MIKGIFLYNFRIFKEIYIPIYGYLPTFVGKNDVGKSSILHALEIFFGGRKLTAEDLNSSASEHKIRIGVCFKLDDDINKVELEDGVETTLLEENLYAYEDEEFVLCVIKEFDVENGSETILLKVYDYDDPDFAYLPIKKEKELNTLLVRYGFEVKRAGRGVLNKDKREQLRSYAEEHHIRKLNKLINIKRTRVEPVINQIVKDTFFILYPAEQSLNKADQPLLEELKPLITQVIHKLGEDDKRRFEEEINKSIEDEVNKIVDIIKEFGLNLFLNPRINFKWEKVVELNFEAADENISVSLNLRGTGIRRLILAAIFRWLAEEKSIGRYIFAIEEPEAFLHPSLIYQLMDSLNNLSRKGVQIFMTTHSDKVVAQVSRKDLILIKEDQVNGEVILTYPNVDVVTVAKELGVSLRSELLTKKLAIFVEGKQDMEFFTAFFDKLYENDVLCISSKDVVIIPSGGFDNILVLIEIEDLKNLGKNFLVIVDNKNINIESLISNVPSEFRFILRKEDVVLYIPKKSITQLFDSQLLESKLRSVNATFEDFEHKFNEDKSFAKRLISSLNIEIDKLIYESDFKDLASTWVQDNDNELIRLNKKLCNIT